MLLSFTTGKIPGPAKGIDEVQIEKCEEMKTKPYIFLVSFVFSVIIAAMPSQGCSKSEPPVQNLDTTPAPPNPPPPPPPPVSYMGNGVNLQPSYYNSGNVDFAWSLMKQQTKIKTVRIEIEPTADIGLARSWIQQAKDNGYDVIATYHKYTVLGSDDPNDLMDGANWWKTHYDSLSTAGSFTINLMNEWGDHNLSSNAYADAYNQAIGTVRQLYSGPIIIDCPGWGQETAIAAAAVKGTNGTKIIDTNIILSVHIYPNGWNQAKNHNLQNADLDDLASAGRKCIVGEFGNAPSGSVDWSGMVTYAKSKGWPVIGWSWNGDGGTMNMVTPGWSTNAQASSFNTNAYFDIIYALL